jgi:hypothetical protein
MRAGEYAATRLLEWGEFLLLNVNEISDSHRIMHKLYFFFSTNPPFPNSIHSLQNRFYGTELAIGWRSGVRIPIEADTFLLSKTSISSVGFTDLPVRWGTFGGGVSLWIKQAELSSTSCAEINNKWSYSSISSSTSCHVKTDPRCGTVHLVAWD